MRTDNYNFFDRLFENELNYVIEKTRNAYESMLFRDVAKFCFFDLHAIREEYARLSNHMHRDLVIRYIEVQLILLSPITPHICEQIWKMLDEKL